MSMTHRTLGAAVTLFMWTGFAWGAEGIHVQDTRRVYYGDWASATTAGAVDTAQVFAQIPEYREIARRRLTRSEPEYWLLLVRANGRLSRAIHAAATECQVDMVGEQGVIRSSDAKAIIDVTAAVIRSLE